MTSNPEVQTESLDAKDIAAYFRHRVREYCAAQSIRPSQLARLAAVSKPTVSSIFAETSDTTRLPNLLNSMRIAQALNVQVEDLLPDLSFDKQKAEILSASYINAEIVSLDQVFGVIQSVAPWKKAYFCPDTIPEFCKTKEFIMSESGLSETAATAYMSNIKFMDFGTIEGVMVLKENILKDLLEHRNRFSKISAKNAYEMFANLREYIGNCSPNTRVVVSDPTQGDVDTILVLNDRVAVTYPFGSYFVTSEPLDAKPHKRQIRTVCRNTSVV